MKKSEKTHNTPAVIAASTSGGNPIVSSFLAGKRNIEDLKLDEITETVINEPLVSWKSLDGTGSP